KLSEGEPPLRKVIEAKIQAMVLDIRNRRDDDLADGHATPTYKAISQREIDDVEIRVTYDHRAKSISARVLIGLLSESTAICDLDNESVGSVEFKPSSLLYTPDKAAKKGGKAAVAPQTAAPSNAPRLTSGGALKA
ncbi:MAG: hypothetical protein Q7U75_20070, partial [Desulfobacterales bacterium]|nr:hypothetical protein [Desulfobacterales bacterium]